MQGGSQPLNTGLWHPPGVGGIETLAILGVVLALLVTNRVRIDMIGLFLFLSLSLLHLVPTAQLFQGFGSEAVIVIAGMLVMGDALVLSGVTEWIGALVARMGGRREGRLMTALMAVAGALSGFISDVGLVTIFLPVVLGFRKRYGIAPSRLLLPLALAAMLGGLTSMVGSSSNIIANQILSRSGIGPLGLFAIAPLGFTLLLTTLLYMLLLGRRRLPQGHTGDSAAESEGEGGGDRYHGIRQYITQLEVPPSSPWVGRPLRDIAFFREHGMTVVRILRPEPVLYPGAADVLRPGDLLMVQAEREELMKLDRNRAFLVENGVSGTGPAAQAATVAEAMVLRGSPLVGRTLKTVQFRQRYRTSVLAVWRNGRVMTQKLADTPFAVGDVLLLQGPEESIRALLSSDELLVLSEAESRLGVRHKGPLALGILVAVLAAAAWNLVSLPTATVLGVTAMVLTGITSMRRAYQAVEWRILVLIAAMIPLGDAMNRTGIIRLLSSLMVHTLGALGPYALLAGFFWLSAGLTQVLSNFATALLITPVAISAASMLHLSPLPFVVTVIAAVSASPLTPVSNKVHLLVMGPGGYRYFDFLRIGIPLTVLLFAVTTATVPLLWPFHAP